MSLRDDVLPPIDAARQIIDDLGFRRFSLTIRKRSWTINGSAVAPGTPGATATRTDLVITPRPRGRSVSEAEIAASGGTYKQGDIRFDKITPAFSGAQGSGGYTPAQLYPTFTAASEDICCIVTDDEGTFEATIVSFQAERSFTVEMVVRRIRGAVRG